MTTRSITGAGVPYPSNHTLAYDAANRLISATPQPSGSATTYGYDGHDRRVAATPPGGVTKLTMYSKAGQLLSEIRTNGSARVNYVYLGRHLLARVPYNSFGTGGGLGSAPPKLFQHTDGLGTPIAVTDASGVLQGQRSVYEAYGDKVGMAEADGPGYTGHVADGLTGLTYMQARFYDPVAGRFLSIDPVAADIGNFNRYWYANNSPYKFVDPDGRYIEAAFEAASLAIGVKSTHDNFNQGNYGAAAVDAVGVLVDGVLAAVPIVPGVAGILIQGSRQADNLTDAVGLGKKLASEQQMAELASGQGVAMAGAGTETVLRQAERLAVDHGGDAADWSKVTSSSYTAADGQKIQTHAYQNEKIGKVVEPKTKID